MTAALGVLVPALAMLMMTIVGLGLVPADFAPVRARPGWLLGVTLVQWPLGLVAAVLLARSPLASAAGAAGLALLAAAPAAPLANVYAQLARGPVALAVGVTALSSIAATLLTPLVATLALAATLERTATVAPPLGNLAQQVLLVLTLPLAAGMALRRLAPHTVARYRRALTGLALAALALLVAAVLASQWPRLRDSLASDGLLALAYTGTLLALARVVSLAWPGGMDWRAVGWGFAARNTAVATALALAVLRDEAVVGFLAVLMVTQVPVLALLAGWAGRGARP
jgi:BASS family bile acid:Na+ symporter